MDRLANRVNLQLYACLVVPVTSAGQDMCGPWSWGHLLTWHCRQCSGCIGVTAVHLEYAALPENCVCISQERPSPKAEPGLASGASADLAATSTRNSNPAETSPQTAQERPNTSQDTHIDMAQAHQQAAAGQPRVAVSSQQGASKLPSVAADTHVQPPAKLTTTAAAASGVEKARQALAGSTSSSSIFLQRCQGSRKRPRLDPEQAPRPLQPQAAHRHPEAVGDHCHFKHADAPCMASADDASRCSSERLPHEGPTAIQEDAMDAGPVSHPLRSMIIDDSPPQSVADLNEHALSEPMLIDQPNDMPEDCFKAGGPDRSRAADDSVQPARFSSRPHASRGSTQKGVWLPLVLTGMPAQTVTRQSRSHSLRSSSSLPKMLPPPQHNDHTEQRGATTAPSGGHQPGRKQAPRHGIQGNDARSERAGQQGGPVPGGQEPAGISHTSHGGRQEGCGKTRSAGLSNVQPRRLTQLLDQPASSALSMAQPDLPNGAPEGLDAGPGSEVSSERASSPFQPGHSASLSAQRRKSGRQRADETKPWWVV